MVNLPNLPNISANRSQTEKRQKVWILNGHPKIVLGQFWGDSWWFANQSEIGMRWFLVIHESVWNWYGTILGDSWVGLRLIWDNSWWFMNRSEIFMVWFWVVLGGSWISLKSVWDNSRSLTNQIEIVLRWFMVIHKSVWNCFGGILSNSWWFMDQWLMNDSSMIHESVWNCYGAILGDSWWFMNKSEIVLGDSGWLLVIHESVWNFLGWFLVILNDSQTDLLFTNCIKFSNSSCGLNLKPIFTNKIPI